MSLPGETTDLGKRPFCRDHSTWGFWVFSPSSIPFGFFRFILKIALKQKKKLKSNEGGRISGMRMASPFPQTIRGVGTMHSNAVGQEPMLRGMLGKCPLHIYNLTSRGSILDVHYLHPKEFIKRYLAQKHPIINC